MAQPSRKPRKPPLSGRPDPRDGKTAAERGGPYIENIPPREDGLNPRLVANYQSEEQQRSARARDSERLIHTYKLVHQRFDASNNTPVGFLGWHVINVISCVRLYDTSTELLLLLESDDIS
jgi:hypothetical protein